MRVLVVDDSKDMTDAITLYCDTEKDLDCHVINDGQEALERIRKEKFDLILLDLSIPEFSGLDVGKLSSSDLDSTRMSTFTYRVRTPQYSFMVPKIKVASAI